MRLFVYQLPRASRKIYIDLDHVLMVDVDLEVRTPPIPNPLTKIMMDVHSWEVALTMAFRNEPVILRGSKMVPAGEPPGALQPDELLAAWRSKE